MKQLKKWVDDGSVDTIIVAGIDLQGRLYGKRCDARVFLRDLSSGIHTCDCNFGWDIARMLVDNLKFTGWHTGYGDMTTVPDWNTLRMYPWFDNTALVLCDTFDHHGNPIEIGPRQMLRKQLAKAGDLGFTVKAAPEVEFFLFRETIDSSRAKGYRDLEPISNYISDYSVFRSSMDEWVLGDMRRYLDEANIEVESNKSEWGHGQIELNLVYCEALEMADRHVIFKNAVREIAALNGVQASFMAKWDPKHSGNGCHVHMSLWNGDKPAFHDPNEDREMSKTMRHFLGGMMALASDLHYFYAPTINSYKRLEDSSFAPTNVTWGGDNRTPAFRCAGHGNSMRLENRIPGSDVNACLAYAAMVASGLYGIENELEPIGDYVVGNAYELKDAPKLHRNLIDSVNALDASAPVRKILGDDVVDHYVALGRWEIREFFNTVTDWERERYFELV